MFEVSCPVVPPQKLSNIAAAAFVTRRERKIIRHNEHVQQQYCYG